MSLLAYVFAFLLSAVAKHVLIIIGHNLSHMQETLKLSQAMSTRMLHDACAENSKDLIKKHLLSLSNQDIIKILTPVKARLLSEDTVLHINTLNFSVDHVITPLTVKEVLEMLGPTWQRWIHNGKSFKLVIARKSL